VNLRFSFTVFVHLFADLGECYTFGSNQFHQLGHDKMVDGRCPRKVVNLDFYNITAVGCGDTFTIAISKGNDVLSGRSVKPWDVLSGRRGPKSRFLGFL